MNQYNLDMKRIRVLHILKSNKFSGAENIVINLINGLKDDVNFLYMSSDGDIRNRLNSENINHYLVDKVNLRSIKNAIDEFNPDIIHAHDFTCSVLASFFGFKKKVISHLHSNPLFIKKICLKTIIFFISCFNIKKIFIVSKSIIDEYIFGSFLLNKTILVSNPINKERILKLSNEATEFYFDIIYIGRLSIEKNPKRFLDIIEKIKINFIDIKVGIIGDGELKEDILDMINKKNLSNNVSVLGFLDNPYNILKNSKILCITSQYEGFGLVALEAFLLGKPVVSTYVGGLKDIIDSSTGFFCKSNNDFINKILLLLNDKKVYDNLSRNAIKRVEEFLDIRDYSKKILEIYNSL